MDDIRAAGGQLVAIGNGAPPFAEAFVEELENKGRKPTFPIVTDPSRETYRAFDLKRPLLGGDALGLMQASVRAARAGHRQTRTRGDAQQLGGVVVMDTTGAPVYVHIEEHAGDLADIDEVIAALRRLSG